MTADAAVPFTAYYNKPDDERDLVAHFHSAPEANAYADKYGGTVDAQGVVFTVGRGADHGAAREDKRNERNAAELAAAKALVAANEPPKSKTKPDGDA